MSEELRPCPFCGHPGIFIDFDMGFYTCQCNKCTATSQSYLGESGAIEVRNTRPIEDTLRAEIAALKAELERVEWTGDYDDGKRYWICPWCRMMQFQGHAADCPRQLALNQNIRSTDKPR